MTAKIAKTSPSCAKIEPFGLRKRGLFSTLPKNHVGNHLFIFSQRLDCCQRDRLLQSGHCDPSNTMDPIHIALRKVIIGDMWAVMIPHPVKRVHSLEIWLVFNRDWHWVLVFFGPHVHIYGPYTMIGNLFLHILIL